VAHARLGLLPGVAERVAERAEENRHRGELQADDDPPPPPELAERVPDPHPR
jgi:hypothetical protein